MIAFEVLVPEMEECSENIVDTGGQSKGSTAEASLQSSVQTWHNPNLKRTNVPGTQITYQW